VLPLGGFRRCRNAICSQCHWPCSCYRNHAMGQVTQQRKTCGGRCYRARAQPCLIRESRIRVPS